LFSQASRPALGLIQSHVQWERKGGGSLFLGINRPECAADHSPPCSVEAPPLSGRTNMTALYGILSLKSCRVENIGFVVGSSRILIYFQWLDIPTERLCDFPRYFEPIDNTVGYFKLGHDQQYTSNWGTIIFLTSLFQPFFRQSFCSITINDCTVQKPKRLPSFELHSFCPSVSSNLIDSVY
jgi:hypothetical protein